MEKEVRQDKVQQKGLPHKLQFTVANLVFDGLVFGAIDSRRRDASDEGDSLGNSLFQFGEIRLAISKSRDLHPGQPCDAGLRTVGGNLDLLGKIQHVGGKARIDKLALIQS